MGSVTLGTVQQERIARFGGKRSIPLASRIAARFDGVAVIRIAKHCYKKFRLSPGQIVSLDRLCAVSGAIPFETGDGRRQVRRRKAV